KGKGRSFGADEEGFVEVRKEQVKKVDYSVDHDSEDEIKSVDNEMSSYLASKPSGVGYGTKSLLEQWRKTYVDDDYDPYDNDMYEGQDIPDIVTIFNLYAIIWISGITIYGSHLLILSAYAPLTPPLISLPLSMACDDSDGCVTNVIGSYAVKQVNRASLLDSQPCCIFDQFLFHEKSYLGRAARARVAAMSVEASFTQFGDEDTVEFMCLSRILTRQHGYVFAAMAGRVHSNYGPYLQLCSPGYGTWFSKLKKSGGRGVKEKNLNRNMKNTSSGISLSTDSEDTTNDDTSAGVASAIQEGVAPSVVDMTVEMGKQNSLDDTIVSESFPPLSTPLTTTAGNAPGKSLYANITSKPSGKKVNVRTLFTPGGNGIDVVVPVDSIRAISKRFANTAYSFFLGKKVAYPIVASYMSCLRMVHGLSEIWHPDENVLKEDVSTVPFWVKLHGVPVMAFSEDGLSAISTKLSTSLMLDSYTSDMCMQSWGRSSYARVLIELHVDVELKDNIVVVVPKITKEGHYTCNVCVEYEWKPPRCLSGKVFGHVHEECTKNTGVDEKKIVIKPSQTSRGVPVGPKIGFKPQKEYRPVTKNPNACFSGNKKKCVEPTIEVSNSNPFDVLNSVDNDGEFGTNGRTNNLVNNEATSSGSSFMNIDNDGKCTCNTPIGAKIDKIKRQIGEGIPTSGNDESDKGYGTNSLLEQWRDSFLDNDDYDSYDDDMYENHDLSEHLQSICDDLDIT
nr:hypothetical protein [Tanacetum cinerariifolium]